MAEQIRITIGSIRETAASNYRIFGQKLSFAQAFRMAAAQKKTWPGYQLGATEEMPLEMFWRYIDAIPLIAFRERKPETRSSIPEYYGNFYMREEHLFLDDDDIMTYIHVPYIFDGIHTHDHFEINYVYHGQCTLQFHGGEQTMQEGTLFVLAPDFPHNVFDEGDSLILSVMVRKSTFDTVFSAFLKTDNPLSRFFRDAIYGAGSGGCLILDTHRSATARRYMQRLMVEFYQSDPFHNINAICLLSLVFSHIVRDDPEYTVYYDFTDSSSGNLNFAVLLQYIRQNYGTVNLERLSRHFHYSQSFLSRLIQRRTGQKFSSMVKQMKMEHARALLMEGQLSVKEVSDAVGYDSPNHFSRAFKEYYGMTPFSCREQGRRLGQPETADEIGREA